jgi:membrane-associated phospholipid phosphatase
MKKIIYLSFSLLLITQNLFSQSHNFDYRVLKNLSTLHNPADNNFQKFISNSAPYISMGTPIIMVGAGLITKNKNLTQQGLQTGAALTFTVGTTFLIKKLVNRPRPYVTYPDLKNLSTEGSASFPSGHTSTAFSIATSLSMNYRKWYVIAPAYIWAGATGYSRMYQNVHYPTDVLAGAALGSFSAWATYKANKAWFK